MIERRINSCYNCAAWDDEREGCTMPAPDRQYACPLEYDMMEIIGNIHDNPELLEGGNNNGKAS